MDYYNKLNIYPEYIRYIIIISLNFFLNFKWLAQQSFLVKCATRV